MSESLIKAWKSRVDYLGEWRKTTLYSSWRARVFTKKGKKQGFPKEWSVFNNFKDDMLNGWESGKILLRKDKTKIFSKDNCYWGNKEECCDHKFTTLTYDNSTKTLLEWCSIYDLNYNGVRQRFFKGKNYSSEQILFGKTKRFFRVAQDFDSIKDKKKQNNKISKMLSAYKNKDKKRNFEFNLDKDFLKNIVKSECVYCGSKKNVGCDRIDNKKGHTKDNVLPCCNECNTVRNNLFSVEEMKQIGEVIKIIRNQRGDR